MASGIPFIGGMAQAAEIGAESEETRAALKRERAAMLKNAEISREAGAYNAARQQDEAYQVFGTQQADASASGTELTSGSILDLLRQSHTNAEMDRLNILHSAEMEAFNFENKAAGISSEIESIKRMTKHRQLSAILSGASAGAARLPARSGGDPTPTHKPNNYGATNGGGYGSAGGSSRGGNYA